jgi:hypothetical protein
MAALQTGTRTTFNSTVGLKIDLSDAAPFIVDPDDVPLSTRIKKKGPTVNMVKHEWLEDSLIPTTDTFSTVADATTTSITATNGDRFKAGYVVQLESEQVRVSSVAGNILTVQRSYAGTTGAAHTTPSAKIVGYAVTDGADPAQFSTTNRVSKYNLHQVFQEAVTVSMLEEWQENYGVGDKYSYEVMKQLKKLAIIKENLLFKGQRFEDTTNGTRTMGGLDYYITTNVTDLAGAITISAINTALKTCYNAGGKPTLIVVSPKQKLVLDYLITSVQLQFPRVGTDEKLGQSISKFQSSFGTLDILMDRWCDDARAYILDESTIRWVNGRPFTLETLAKTGTATKGEIVGFGSLEVKSETWSHILKGLT